MKKNIWIFGIIIGICLLVFLFALKNKIIYKLLLATVNSEEQARLRDNLSSQNIGFFVKELQKFKKGIIAFRGQITGYYNFEEKNNPSYVYVFYVKRWQYKKALNVIKK